MNISSIPQRRTGQHGLAALGLLLSLALVALMGPLAGSAYAEDNGGEFGTNCEWAIDDNGNMTIGPKTAGEEASFTGDDWNALKDEIGESTFQGITSFEVTDKIEAIGSLKRMLFACEELESADLSKLDTSEVTSLEEAFSSCTSMKSVKTGGEGCGWNTSNVTTMRGTFNNCIKLEDPDVADWDTFGATTMTSMFNGCWALKSLDLSGWDTSNVKNMDSLFHTCKSLETLNVADWDTSEVTSMTFAFNGCSSLKSLDLSGWDTPKAQSLDSLSQTCKSLETPNASDWDDSKVEAKAGVYGMFSKCDVLEKLKVGTGWKAKNVELPEGTPAGVWCLNGGSTVYTTIQPGKAGTYKKYIPEKIDANNVTLSCTAIGEVLDTETNEVKKYPATTYSGKKKTPTVTVRNAAGTKLTKNTHYTVSYSSSTRKYVGTYTVTIKGKGKYTGTVKKTFIIKPKSTSIYSATATAGGFTMKWSKRTTQTSGYELRYGTDLTHLRGSYDTCRIESNKTCSKKVTGLEGGMKYYGKVRTYKAKDGKLYYSSWSSAKSVTTKVVKKINEFHTV